MKLYIQPNGSVCAIVIESQSATEIKQQYWSFFNHGAVDKTASLIQMSPTFSYIWTTPAKLKEYFLRSSFAMCLNEDAFGRTIRERYKGQKGGILKKAKELANERQDDLITDKWISTKEVSPVYAYAGNSEDTN